MGRPTTGTATCRRSALHLDRSCANALAGDEALDALDALNLIRGIGSQIAFDRHRELTGAALPSISAHPARGYCPFPSQSAPFFCLGHYSLVGRVLQERLGFGDFGGARTVRPCATHGGQQGLARKDFVGKGVHGRPASFSPPRDLAAPNSGPAGAITAVKGLVRGLVKRPDLEHSDSVEVSGFRDALAGSKLSLYGIGQADDGLVVVGLCGALNRVRGEEEESIVERRTPLPGFGENVDQPGREVAGLRNLDFQRNGSEVKNRSRSRTSNSDRVVQEPHATVYVDARRQDAGDGMHEERADALRDLAALLREARRTRVARRDSPCVRVSIVRAAPGRSRDPGDAAEPSPDSSRSCRAQQPEGAGASRARRQ